MDYKRDEVREDLFNASYKIKPEIHIKYELNTDGTFKTFTLNFKFRDKVWILEEVYKDNTNMTDYCTLTGTDEKFKRFVDAELKLLELMKDGNPY
jgi:hypothetical protein